MTFNQGSFPKVLSKSTEKLSGKHRLVSLPNEYTYDTIVIREKHLKPELIVNNKSKTSPTHETMPSSMNLRSRTDTKFQSFRYARTTVKIINFLFWYIMNSFILLYNV